MGEEEGKVTGIWHIVRLRGMLQKWHSHTVRPKEDKGMPPSIPPVINKRLKMVTISCDSDDDQCQSPEPPPDVPRGYLAVYVGEEHRRFVIPTNYLGQPVFKALLSKAEEEFGFDHNGALTFPCDIETFKYILQCMERHKKGLIDDEGNPINI